MCGKSSETKCMVGLRKRSSSLQWSIEDKNSSQRTNPLQKCIYNKLWGEALVLFAGSHKYPQRTTDGQEALNGYHLCSKSQSSRSCPQTSQSFDSIILGLNWCLVMETASILPYILWKHFPTFIWQVSKTLERFRENQSKHESHFFVESREVDLIR